MRLLALQTVLAAVDIDGSSRPALTSARDLAAAAGAELHVLYVAPTHSSVEGLEREAREAGIAHDRAHMWVVAGDPAHEINIMADRLGADVIVLGPHRDQKRRDGGRPRGLSSTALAVVTNASVPCLVVRQELHLPLDHVVVGIDFSDSDRGTLAVALSWASALRSRASERTELTAIHVTPASAGASGDGKAGALERALAPVRRKAGDWSGVTLRSEATTADDAATGIADYAGAHAAALVTLGTRGLGLDATGRLGSVASEVIHRTDAPVLLVPPAMWSAATAAT